MQSKMNNLSYQFIQTVVPNRLIEKKENTIKGLTAFFLLFEFLLMTILFFGLYYYRIAIEYDQPIHFSPFHIPRLYEYFLFYFISSSIYYVFLFKNKAYHFVSSKSYLDQYLKVAGMYSYAILITIGLAFVLKIVSYSRFVILSYWASVILLSGMILALKRGVFFYLSRKDVITKRVAIIGTEEVGQHLARELERNKHLGYRVVGFLDTTLKNKNKEFPYKIIGDITEIINIIDKYAIDEVIITNPSQREMVNRLIEKLRKLSVTIKIIPDMFNLVTSSIEFGNINVMPYMTLIKTPMRGISLYIKRIFDIILSSVLLLLLLPLLIVVGVLIKLDSPGPIFFKQQRVGKNGRLFYMYKFRSMVLNADKLQRKLIKDNEMDGPVFKIRDDPRITRIGKFIRKYSIDELPQLLNVLKGEMSLVGPRPPLPKEVLNYGDWEWRRLEVNPGITGLWQVSGRSDLSFQQWVHLDIYYIENWSLLLDLKILLKTIPVVLRGEGAY